MSIFSSFRSFKQKINELFKSQYNKKTSYKKEGQKKLKWLMSLSIILSFYLHYQTKQINKKLIKNDLDVILTYLDLNLKLTLLIIFFFEVLRRIGSKKILILIIFISFCLFFDLTVQKRDTDFDSDIDIDTEKSFIQTESQQSNNANEFVLIWRNEPSTENSNFQQATMDKEPQSQSWNVKEVTIDIHQCIWIVGSSFFCVLAIYFSVGRIFEL